MLFKFYLTIVIQNFSNALSPFLTPFFPIFILTTIAIIFFIFIVVIIIKIFPFIFVSTLILNLKEKVKWKYLLFKVWKHKIKVIYLFDHFGPFSTMIFVYPFIFFKFITRIDFIFIFTAINVFPLTNFFDIFNVIVFTFIFPNFMVILILILYPVIVSVIIVIRFFTFFIRIRLTLSVWSKII